MYLVKIIRHGQITLPVQLRKALNLKEGTYLEARLEEDRIVLKPVIPLEREEVVEKLLKLLDKVQSRTEEVGEEEIEREIMEVIQEIRKGRRND